jgi:hypothetical protein
MQTYMKAIKFLAVLTAAAMLPACGSYNNKFAGYKDKDYLDSCEAKQVVLANHHANGDSNAGGSNPKPFATTYELPRAPMHMSEAGGASSEPVQGQTGKGKPVKVKNEKKPDLTLPPNFD